MKKVIIILLGVVVLAGGAYALTRNSADNSSNSSENTQTPSSSTGSTTQQQTEEPTEAEEQAVATDSISIQNNQFTPRLVTAKVGDTITWTNKDSVQHSVVPDDGVKDFVASELLPKDEIYTYTFNKAGTYTYHCGPHPGMTGTVTVTE